jgi:DNA/RNA-binding domain of Phe-tRNA-synthetase-like protein
MGTDAEIIIPVSVNDASPIVVDVINFASLYIVPGPTGAHDADIANDELIAELADVAQLLVPIKLPKTDPVNDPVNEPVLICVELDTNVGLFATFVYST